MRKEERVIGYGGARIRGNGESHLTITITCYKWFYPLGPWPLVQPCQVEEVGGEVTADHANKTIDCVRVAQRTQANHVGCARGTLSEVPTEFCKSCRVETCHLTLSGHSSCHSTSCLSDGGTSSANCGESPGTIASAVEADTEVIHRQCDDP